MSQLRGFLGLFRPYALEILAAVALVAVASAIPAGTVLLLEHAVDELVGKGQRDALLWVCAGFAGLALVRAAVVLARTWLTKRVAFAVASTLRRRLHHQLLLLEPDAPLGSRLAALTHEVDEVQYGVSALVTAIRNPLTLIGLAATAGWIAPELAGWGLVLVPIVAGTSWWSGRRVNQSARDAREARADLAALAGDQLEAAQIFVDPEAESDRFAGLDGRDRRARTRLEVERILPSAATQAVVAVAAAILVWVGGAKVLDRSLLPGEFLGFAVALGLMHRPLAGLAEVWALLQRATGALERVNAVLDRVPPADPVDPLPIPARPAELRIEGLCASWVPDRPVLNQVELQLRPGEIAALTGPSGAGKSTLFAAIRGVLEPSSGVIRLGGTPLERLARADRRRAIGWVPQRNQLLDRTLAENVTVGRPASEQAIRGALERAGADFVERLPDGIHTRVGERGALLSGGERQRVCIARALLDQPLVLLLDEATNQLDPIVQARILEDLRARAGDCAILMAAHDPAVVALADRVFALEAGELRIERAGPRVLAWRAP